MKNFIAFVITAFAFFVTFFPMQSESKGMDLGNQFMEDRIILTRSGEIIPTFANSLPSFDQHPHFPYLFNEPQPHHYDDQREFQGIPTITRESGGRLWAAWYGGGVDEGPENFIMLVTSDDDGETWSDFNLIIQAPFRTSEPMLWIDPNGRMWFAFALSPIDLHRPGGQLWVITADNPSVHNPTWSEPRLLAMEVFNISKPTVLSSGTWIFPTLNAQFTAERMPPPSAPLGLMSRPLLSKDEGKSFVPGGEISIEPHNRNYDEYMIVERKDGVLWLLTRTAYGIGESFSTDKGVNWSPVERSVIGNTPSRFFLSRLNSGNLLLIKNGPIDQNVGRTQMTAFLSKDDGATWNDGLVIDARSQVSYPDAVEGDDGFIRVIYDRGRYTTKEILMARITEEDIVAGALVNPRSSLEMLVNRATGDNPIATDMQTVHPLQKGEGATFVGDDSFSVKPLKKGEEVFVDREIVWQDFPEELAGSNYLFRSIDGGALEVASGGLVYVATHRPTAVSRYSLQLSLVEQGFLLTPLREFYHADPHLGSLVVWQKSVSAGERINVGKLGIVILPRANDIDNGEIHHNSGI
jgi:hypothetical protein